MGNAAIQEMLNNNSIDPTSIFASAYQNHEQQEPSLKIALNASQMRNVQLFQVHWEQNKARYQQVSNQSNVPAKLIAALHWRESSGNFNTYLHQGDPLGKPAVNWPNNIPLFHKWEDAAIHALNMKRYNQQELSIEKDTNDFSQIATYAEAYNGLGYSNHDRQSPYVYAGSSPYVSGKYVADGRYDSKHVDQQVGVVPLMGSIHGIESNTDLNPQLMNLETAWDKVKNSQILLRRGMDGIEVTALQHHLKDLGYMETIDGDFGPTTERAIRQFQQDHDLTVDALIGSGTAAQIDAALRYKSSRSQADTPNIN
jgi:lysozyme family protein